MGYYRVILYQLAAINIQCILIVSTLLGVDILFFAFSAIQRLPSHFVSTLFLLKVFQLSLSNLVCRIIGPIACL